MLSEKSRIQNIYTGKPYIVEEHTKVLHAHKRNYTKKHQCLRWMMGPWIFNFPPIIRYILNYM